MQSVHLSIFSAIFPKNVRKWYQIAEKSLKMSENYDWKNGGKKLKMAEKICQSGGENFLKHGHYG